MRHKYYWGLYTHSLKVAQESKHPVTETARMMAYAAADVGHALSQAGALGEPLKEALKYNGCTALVSALSNGYVFVVLYEPPCKAPEQDLVKEIAQGILNREFDECSIY